MFLSNMADILYENTYHCLKIHRKAGILRFTIVNLRPYSRPTYISKLDQVGEYYVNVNVPATLQLYSLYKINSRLQMGHMAVHFVKLAQKCLWRLWD